MDIPKIVDILLLDPILVENWGRLYSGLGLPVGDKVQLENGFRSGILNSEQLLVKILEKWVSGKEAKVAIETLCEILKEAKFKMVSGNSITKLYLYLKI